MGNSWTNGNCNRYINTLVTNDTGAEIILNITDVTGEVTVVKLDDDEGSKVAVRNKGRITVEAFDDGESISRVSIIAGYYVSYVRCKNGKIETCHGRHVSGMTEKWRIHFRNRKRATLEYRKDFLFTGAAMAGECIEKAEKAAEATSRFVPLGKIPK